MEVRDRTSYRFTTALMQAEKYAIFILDPNNN